VIDQNEYGKYGIIREENFFAKQRYKNTCEHYKDFVNNFLL
jgi:hypothetical protein